MKTCRDCGAEKSIEEFYRHPETADGRNPYCMTCHSARSRATHLKRKYGLKPEQYRAMVESQENRCAICMASLDVVYHQRSATTPCVDHCHTTGQVRGILCRHCNTAIGLLRESPDSLQSAIDYLRKTS